MGLAEKCWLRGKNERVILFIKGSRGETHFLRRLFYLSLIVQLDMA